MFDAPPALKKYLIQFHRMHEIPVFFDLDVEGGAAILREQPKIKTVLTKTDALQRKGSKYVKDHSLNRDTIPQPKRLKGIDASRQRKLEEDIATYEDSFVYSPMLVVSVPKFSIIHYNHN